MTHSRNSYSTSTWGPKPDGAVSDLRLWFDNDPKYIQIPSAVLTTFPITSALGAIVEATVSFQTSGLWSVVWS